MGQQGDWLHVRLYEFDEDEDGEEDKDNDDDVRFVTVSSVKSTIRSRLLLRCVYLVTS